MLKKVISGFLAFVMMMSITFMAVPAITAYAAEGDMYAGTDKADPDSDYDGIADQYDSNDSSASFSGLMFSSFENGAKYSFTMDFRDFFGDNKEYHQNLAAVSVLGASLAYYEPGGGNTFKFDPAVAYAKGTSEQVDGIKFLETFGFEDVVDYTLDEYKDDDMCEVVIGRKTVTYNGVTKIIIALWVRGTEATSAEEWSSNFNVGDLVRFFDEYDSVAEKENRGKNEDWTRKTNHRGFDVCATRLLNYLKKYYLTDHVEPLLKSMPDAKLSYWLTGHSRGASVANIMAAYLIDEGNEVFAYTFASPFSTANTEASAEKYDCIYNLVNRDDFIPTLPMPEWGFTRYGKTAVVPASDYLDEMEDVTGESYKNKYLEPDDMEALLGAFIVITGENADRDNPGKILGWKEVYTYHCGHDHPGETIGNTQDTTIRNATLVSKTEYPDYASRLRKYSYWVDDSGICQTPAYCLQLLVELLVAVAQGNILEGALTYLFDNKLADKFDFGKLDLVPYALKLTDPHHMETYGVIQTQINKEGNPGARFHTLPYYTTTGKADGRPAHTHTYEYVAYEGSEATCTETGFGYKICHCSNVNSEYYDDVIKSVVIPSSGHKWNATYEWAADFSTVTANCTCEVCKHTETLTATPTVKSKTEATKDKAGSIVYSAIFKGSDGKEFTVEKTVEIPAGSDSIAKTGGNNNTVFFTGFVAFCGISLAAVLTIGKRKQLG